MSVRRILRTFDAWRESRQAMVLATVYETIGSTYSKAGHRILIAANGDYQGLVSGGCLEGDMAERARRVLDSGVAAAVTYDLRDDADDLWGLGVGCNGLIRVFLQPLAAASGYEPFASLARQVQTTERAAVATVISSPSADVPAGATLIVEASGAATAWQLERRGGAGELLRRLETDLRRVIVSGRARYDDGVREGDGVAVLLAPLLPVPRLLVLGAGLDAIPVVGMAGDLGWFVTVADHRPAYIARGGFDSAEHVVELDPRTLRDRLPLNDFDAILVMSHHLVTDQTYLSQLSGTQVPYIGVLGPPARRKRLLDALGAAAGPLRERLRGPVGLDIGADTPESIALSILAEMQCVLNASRRPAEAEPAAQSGANAAT